MRLTTLARKINKTPSQLITFLEEKGVSISNGLHTKLEESVIKMVVNEFLPEEELDIPVESELNISSDTNLIDRFKPGKEPSEKTEIKDKLSLKGKNDGNEVKEEIQEINNQQKTGTLEDLEEGNLEDIELIKVKKVKLEGIKVVGKIELPEKPKKEDKQIEAKETEETKAKVSEEQQKPVKKPNAHSRKFDKTRSKNRHGKSRQPLSYDEKLKREEREKLRKRRQKEKEDKLRKKQYYVKNIQPKTAPNLKKKKKKKSDDVKSSRQEKVIIHKNPLKRLWAWLNGDYDRY